MYKVGQGRLYDTPDIPVSHRSLSLNLGQWPDRSHKILYYEYRIHYGLSVMLAGVITTASYIGRLKTKHGPRVPQKVQIFVLGESLNTLWELHAGCSY